jgi:NADH/NAD ratio-sensing transcriptional regulator Rex
VRHVTDIPELDPALGVDVALIACSPGWVQMTVDLLHKAGVRGVLLLTPQLKLKRPEGMNVVHVRMPCDIKSLACRCALPDGVTETGTGVMPSINAMGSR